MADIMGRTIAKLKIPELIKEFEESRYLGGQILGYEYVPRLEMLGEIVEENYDTILEALHVYEKQK